MKILLIILIFMVNIYANETNTTTGFSYSNTLNIREEPNTTSKRSDVLKYVQKIEILAIVYDLDGHYWYKTNLGYVYGQSISVDVRYSMVDFLHIRLKPSLIGKIVSYHLTGAKVIVIKNAGKKNGFDWVLTTDGYVAANYLTSSLLHDIKQIKNEYIRFRKIPSKKKCSFSRA